MGAIWKPDSGSGTMERYVNQTQNEVNGEEGNVFF